MLGAADSEEPAGLKRLSSRGGTRGGSLGLPGAQLVLGAADSGEPAGLQRLSSRGGTRGGSLRLPGARWACATAAELEALQRWRPEREVQLALGTAAQGSGRFSEAEQSEQRARTAWSTLGVRHRGGVGGSPAAAQVWSAARTWHGRPGGDRFAEAEQSEQCARTAWSSLGGHQRGGVGGSPAAAAAPAQSAARTWHGRPGGRPVCRG